MSLEAVFGSVLGDLIGGTISHRRDKKAVTRQEIFQERMSNTAYQRAMADMRQAGINPLMVTKLGGASTPTGGAIPSKDLSKIGSNAMKYATTASQIKNLNAQSNVYDSQVKLNESSSAKNIAEMQLKDAQKNKITMETALDSMDVMALQKLGLSPLQMKHTVLNQAGSEFYVKLKEYAKNANKTAEDVFDTIYNYVLKEVREQRNWTIPFVVNNPHLLLKEIEQKLNKGETWFKNLIRKRGWE